MGHLWQRFNCRSNKKCFLHIMCTSKVDFFKLYSMNSETNVHKTIIVPWKPLEDKMSCLKITTQNYLCDKHMLNTLSKCKGTNCGFVNIATATHIAYLKMTKLLTNRIDILLVKTFFWNEKTVSLWSILLWQYLRSIICKQIVLISYSLIILRTSFHGYNNRSLIRHKDATLPVQEFPSWR